MSFTYIPIDLANCLNGIFNSCAVGKAIIRSWGFKRPYLNSEITPPQSKHAGFFFVVVFLKEKILEKGIKSTEDVRIPVDNLRIGTHHNDVLF